MGFLNRRSIRTRLLLVSLVPVLLIAVATERESYCGAQRWAENLG